ncbi:MAG: alpha/beta fold hydrolase [Solirubrobacterales bacterium]|nr:alpha/beta fold hydrolase [Solirubrobacterales bacterium]
MIVQLNRVQTLLAVFATALAAVFLFASMTSGIAEAQSAHIAKTKKSKKSKRKKAVKGPHGLAFYNKRPKKVSKRHGRLIWQRNAHGVVKLKSASSTKTVLYTSKSPAGKRVRVSGTVSVPKGKAPRGGWPVITYGHGTTGIADKCAPSRNKKGGPATSYISYTDDIQNAWLKAGYVVARTDYQGLGTPGTHPFLIGKAEGRGVLDIVRAARNLNPKIGKRFVIAGHSQGGHAALFAAGEAKRFVPELKLKGTVAFAPASHMRLQAASLPVLTTPSSLTALASLIVKGAEAVSSDIDPAALLSDPVLAFYPQTDTECLSELAKPDNLGGIAPSKLIRDGANTDPLFDLLDLQNPAVQTDAPILLAQGDADSTTFPFLTNALNGELVGLGDDVNYITYPSVDHGGVLDAAADDVTTFLNERLPSRR